VARRVSLWQLFVFTSLVAACLGLSVAGQIEAAVFTWFVPGAYLATGLLRASNPRYARRAATSARYGAIGGTLSCLAGSLPICIAISVISPFRVVPLYVDVILSFVAAVIAGVTEGAVCGWLSAKIFADWDRRRRWRLRREKYAGAAK
jgi:hypothetical protein